MQKIKIFLMLFGLSISLSSYGGQDGHGISGLGGFGLLCENKKPILLDLYEAETRYHLQLDLGAPTLSVDQKLDILLNRYEKINSIMAKAFRKNLEDDKAFTGYLDDQVIVIDNKVALAENEMPAIDVGYTTFDDSCSLTPFARSMDTHGLSKNYIFFYRQNVSQIDNDNWAVLKLHESMYLRNSQKLETSEKLRHFIAFLSSSNFDRMTSAQRYKYVHDLNSADYNFSDLFGFTINDYSLYGGVEMTEDSLVNSDDGTFIKTFKFAGRADSNGSSFSSPRRDTDLFGQKVSILPFPSKQVDNGLKRDQARSEIFYEFINRDLALAMSIDLPPETTTLKLPSGTIEFIQAHDKKMDQFTGLDLQQAYVKLYAKDKLQLLTSPQIRDIKMSDWELNLSDQHDNRLVKITWNENQTLRDLTVQGNSGNDCVPAHGYTLITPQKTKKNICEIHFNDDGTVKDFTECRKKCLPNLD